MHGFNIPPDANNLTVAQAMAKAGLPVFPAKVTFNQKKQRWDKEPLVRAGNRKPPPTRKSCASGGTSGRRRCSVSNSAAQA